MGKLTKNLGMYLIFIVLLLSLVNVFMSSSQNDKTNLLSYSEFMKLLDEDEINSVAVSIDSNSDTATIEGKRKGNGATFKTFIVGTNDIAPMLAEKGITVTIKPPEKEPWWKGLLASTLPIILLIGVGLFILHNMQGGGSKVMSFAKSKAKLFLDNRPKVTFDDVAGCDEAKEELIEIVEFLKDPGRFSKLGARVPRGVLLLGVPGTGKTLISRAVAGEADVPFFSISGSDFVEMFVGVGAARVRDLFEQARKYQPCIIFIDEIDAVGRQRGAGFGGGHDEREQTLNQLLVEMDGFQPDSGIIVLAATNRPDILDPALLRPGRFDRQVVVDRPDVNGRLAILKTHIKGKKLADEVNLDVIARRTPGFVGADLANLVNEAALLSGRRNKELIGMHEFEEAIDRVMAGPERKSRLITQREREIIAYHETGHALVARLIPGSDPVHKISIIPRGHQALGYTLQIPEEDRFLISKQELMSRICILLGGRVAEQLQYGDVTTGAQNDLERATGIARQMVTEYGMSEELGPVRLGRKQQEVFMGRDYMEDRNYSEQIAFSIDKEVRRILDECFSRVAVMLEDNTELLNIIAKELLDKEILETEDLDRILGTQTEETQNSVKETPGPEDTPDGERESDATSQPQVKDTLNVATAE